MELVPLVTEIAKTFGPTGALGTVIFSMWFKNRNGGHSTENARAATGQVINEDHDVITTMAANVTNIKDDIAEVKGDVKGLLKDSHTHLVP